MLNEFEQRLALRLQQMNAEDGLEMESTTFNQQERIVWLEE